MAGPGLCLIIAFGPVAVARASEAPAPQGQAQAQTAAASEPAIALPDIRPHLKPDLKALMHGGQSASAAAPAASVAPPSPPSASAPRPATVAPTAPSAPSASTTPRVSAAVHAASSTPASAHTRLAVPAHAAASQPERAQASDAQPAASAALAASAASRPPASMAELRELIDKTISDVRARQAPAPALRLRVHAGAGAPTHRRRRQAGDQAASATPMPTPWTYEQGANGPLHWAGLNPAWHLCGDGHRQSPIDVSNGIPVVLDPVEIDYHPSRYKVINNGHTIAVEVAAGNHIRVNGHSYDLVEIHFHRPSEEWIAGKAFDMEAHLVHRDAQGQLAILAVMFELGAQQPVVQDIWNHLPLETMTAQEAPSTLDLANLLPSRSSYATYMGSLAEPPCTEGVLWVVLKQPVPVSAQEIAVFARLYPMNVRPIQALNGRLIKDGQ